MMRLVGIILIGKKVSCGRCGRRFRKVNRFLNCSRCSRAIAAQNRKK